MSKPKDKRTVSYETHALPHLKRIANWASKGATLLEVAEKLHISYATLRLWRKSHPEFDEALKVACKIANDKVVAATFKRACGYEYEETTEKPLTDVIAKKMIEEYNSKLPEGKTKITMEDFERMFGKETIVTQKLTEYVPGDVTGRIFWLTNREKNEWKHRSEQTVRNEGDMADKLERAKKRLVDAEFKEQVKQSGNVIDIKQKAQGDE